MMYNEAIELYSKAIEIDPNVAVYYGNRSLAYLKTECFGYALNDATKAVELDKNYLKGYYRRAAAYMSLGKFKQALRDFEAVTFHPDQIGLFSVAESKIPAVSCSPFQKKKKRRRDGKAFFQITPIV